LIPILFIAFVLFKIINNPQSLSVITKILNPFLWAFLFAYLLNPALLYLEKKFNLKRGWNILIVYIMLLGFMTLLITIVTPRIIESIRNIIMDMPSYVVTVETWINRQADNWDFLDKYGVFDYIQSNLNNTMNQLNTTLNPILNKTIIQVINITSALFNFIIGLIISIYLLKDKDIFKKGSKNLLYTFLDKDKADNIIEFGRELNIIFSRYLVGKIIDSLIIGVICFIGTLLLKVPYPLFISSIVTVTNMIPYFGPFIGMIPAFIITAFYNPVKAIWVLLFILALQQFDGLYLGPKILGIKVGLKPLWVITAIIVGGGLFGIIGMLLAVPVVAVGRTALNRYMSSKLKEKNINI